MTLPRTLLFFSLYICVNAQDRIIGGSDARKGGFPWMAELVDYGRHFCGGSLIGDGTWVLTAAHCVQYRSVDLFQIVLGEFIRSEDEGEEQTLHVDDIILHPGEIDVALLHLNDTPEFNKFVSPIELSEYPVSEGNPVIVSGWGMTLHQDFSSAADILQQIMMPVVSKDTCDPQFVNQTYPWNQTQIHEFCAGFAGEVYINVCHGDSGSPAVSRPHWKKPFKQVGVVSWGTGGCPEDARYAVFASVPHVYGWIQETIDKYAGKEEGSGENVDLRPIY